jgi:hypothetical protein
LVIVAPSYTLRCHSVFFDSADAASGLFLDGPGRREAAFIAAS